ncbi:SAM-dependent methyltransferase, partial [Candidatus Aerophobetes bacterium]|nr:SAM-dependent methyltransferase [Candidatus Aerophobetes bacterium]
MSKALTLPETYVFKRYFSPLGILHVVKSPFIKYAPGLSLNFQRDIPSQVGIFIDADSMSAVNRFRGDFSNLGYLDFLTLSLPYYLTSQPEILVVGAGGGSEVLNALYHGAKKVFAVEVNPQMIDIVNKDLAEFSGKIYSLPQVKTVVKEARGYVETTHKKFDIIQISLLDSFAASSAGVYALSESYLYTVEALCRFVEHLTPGGFLCITRWIKIPPRDGVRILATS